MLVFPLSPLFLRIEPRYLAQSWLCLLISGVVVYYQRVLQSGALRAQAPMIHSISQITSLRLVSGLSARLRLTSTLGSDRASDLSVSFLNDQF